jgi:DASS family divalent anion:Na+ symporter
MHTTAQTETSLQQEHYIKKFIKTSHGKLALVAAFGALVWFFAKPEAVSAQGWHLFVVFLCTIIAIIAKPLPMSALSLIAISFLTLTKTLSLNTVLQGFAYEQIWLILLACFLARGFIKTGLGKRCAYAFLALFGGTPYGLGYGLLFSSTTIAPLIPSATARTAGIIMPVLRSLVQVLEKENKTGSQKNLAAYLTMIVFHASLITSAIFLTANAASPIAAKFAQNLGVDISWMLWLKASALPGLVSLIFFPMVMLYFFPCSVSHPEKIRNHAKEELGSMGKMKAHEKLLIVIFASLLFLWSFGKSFGVSPTEAAFFGVGLLLLFKVLTWQDLLQEETGWDTFFWMSTLVMMASELQNLGVANWFTDQIVGFIPQMHWTFTLGLLGIIYFYSHYFFASTTAHVSSMYAPFLAVAIATGIPPMYAALILAFFSSLFGGLTHYASAVAPILYAQGFVEMRQWWKIGFITSIFYIVIWMGLGAIWCKFLGIY